MKVTYYGHSVVEIKVNGKSIWIDPFITGNDQCHLNAGEVEADVILLTHGHNDHVGDTVEIAKKNNSLVIAPFELANFIGSKGVDAHPMHIGGAHEFVFGKVKFTQAFHGSSFNEEDGTVVYTGMPSGILFTAEGKTVYHAGDTALFSDMKMIGERNSIDVAFLPIGDNFTMGPDDASVASSWLKAKTVVPVHYNTFPVIEQDPEAFVENLHGKNGQVLKSGESIQL
ncbi:metal-dependent hydrolase [Alkalihalobacillus sp. AL-G]|uniref:metal-dependent hydrolase n=1 Tax=Alkalihalobacillus sp. AL-G TaxID=2926399 RepID=UPI00272C7020|nr:metal-dependent hydrolase [Alkalihalobacillus sp. AL-G]WLD92364.1 metal-dependent hydrolase [Alkalihalobacillus sp. AL-G]